jgi:phage terminase Nu1 subunit (DNA packaging protein)
MSEVPGWSSERYEEEITRLTERLAAAQADSNKFRNERDDNAHVIVECGVCPGVDSPCICEACRRVAILLDEHGFVEDVEEEDRWWDQATEGV